MLELLTLFRPFGKWQVLLTVCLLDLAFIFVQVSYPDLSGSQERRLREVLAQQAAVIQNMREMTRQFEILYRSAAGRARTLQLLDRGIADLEKQIVRLQRHTMGIKANLT